MFLVHELQMGVGGGDIFNGRSAVTWASASMLWESIVLEMEQEQDREQEQEQDQEQEQEVWEAYIKNEREKNKYIGTFNILD